MSILEKRQELLERIAAAALAAGRSPDSVTLLAVSKGQPAAALKEAMEAGQRCFGESYVQELLPKQQQLEQLGLAPELHFIGTLQSNKARKLSGLVSLIHSVDRPSLARALAASVIEGREQNILVELKLSEETGKSGCLEADLPQLMEVLQACPTLRFRGMMTMAPLDAKERARRRVFARLRELLDRCAVADRQGRRPDILSMGMSDDFDDAIREGATIVRIGTALFGPRKIA